MKLVALLLLALVDASLGWVVPLQPAPLSRLYAPAPLDYSPWYGGYHGDGYLRGYPAGGDPFYTRFAPGYSYVGAPIYGGYGYL
ncbi:hypothetical protein FJT64_014348 [Amphibalanus amphitrite]|uniref:Uncharacterized protein n=1 Tax=Amphibalanus amphitrite TaxID=1232801 RepID=A0A6A4VA17_AMPAM|nr:hypothetical protein FJT64_014348 [Amphibalanus amphitrite]